MPPIDPHGSAQGVPAARAALREGFVFGPYRLELNPIRLLRNGDVVALAPRLLTLLHYFVLHAGRVIEKDELIKAVWRDAAMADNNLARLVADLRQCLDDRARDDYIRNVVGVGYRFVASVEPLALAPPPAIDLAALLAPDRDWGRALAALESLSHAGLVTARQLLDPLVSAHPREVRFRIVLAMTCALLYDGTRADRQPDVEMLREAERHAHEALRVNPHSPEAMTAIALVFERLGDRANALAAARNATRVENGNWLNLLCLAWIAFGEERLRAARRVLVVNPGFPIAHWLAATVLVARGAFAEAERHVDAGIASMTSAYEAPARFAPIALHYLKGLLLLARGAVHEALEAFDRELALETRGHVYARECCANTWAAKGVCHLRLGDVTAARAAFGEARARVPGHPMAEAGMEILERRRGGPVARLHGNSAACPHGATPPAAEPPAASLRFERAMATAGLLVDEGDVGAAVTMTLAALAEAPEDNTGWSVPIDPLLRVHEAPDAWAPVLAKVHERAL